MIVDSDTTKLLIETVARRVIASAQELTELDRAIGDGDHGINMERGFEAVLAQVDQLAAQGLANALIGVGTTLVLKVGGASGPLYGTLFMALGKAWPAEATREQVTEDEVFGHNAAVACHMANHSYFHRGVATWDAASQAIKGW